MHLVTFHHWKMTQFKTRSPFKRLCEPSFDVEIYPSSLFRVPQTPLIAYMDNNDNTVIITITKCSDPLTSIKLEILRSNNTPLQVKHARVKPVNHYYVKSSRNSWAVFTAYHDRSVWLWLIWVAYCVRFSPVSHFRNGFKWLWRWCKRENSLLFATT